MTEREKRIELARLCGIEYLRDDFISDKEIDMVGQEGTGANAKLVRLPNYFMFHFHDNSLYSIRGTLC